MGKAGMGIVGALLVGVLTAQAGNFDLKGVFMVVDESGFPLGGVDVGCKVDTGGWKSCGTTQPKAMVLGSGYIKEGTEVNFVQYQPCFPEGNSTVVWRFRKAGYKEATFNEKMPAYPKGTGKDAEIFRKVVMVRLRGESHASGKNPSGSAGFCCMDCGARLVKYDRWDYYCSSCRKGTCRRCNSHYHPTYQVIQKTRLVKSDTLYCECTKH